MSNQNLNAPAFPCVPIQDNFGRLVAAIPGITKLEYFALKIWCNKNHILKIETHQDAIIEAENLLNALEQYQNKKDESSNNESNNTGKIISID
jgi:hypothetical protein